MRTHNSVGVDQQINLSFNSGGELLQSSGGKYSHLPPDKSGGYARSYGVKMKVVLITPVPQTPQGVMKRILLRS